MVDGDRAVAKIDDGAIERARDVGIAFAAGSMTSVALSVPQSRSLQNAVAASRKAARIGLADIGLAEDAAERLDLERAARPRLPNRRRG